MPAATLPTQCAVALKEWATVLESLAQGEQFLLVRKGGLIEPGGGFEMRREAFVFYPTFEHQAVQYLRPPYQRYFETALRQRAPEGHVRFDLAGQAVHVATAGNPQLIGQMKAAHIYNATFATQRLKWQSDQPLTIVLVRVYQLASPVTVVADSKYAGCKSWVELEAPVSLAGAAPVLDDATFQARIAPLVSLLG